MTHAVVDAHQRDLVPQRQGPGDQCTDRERRTHARPFGVADDVDVCEGDLRLRERLLQDVEDVGSVVHGCLVGKEACARRSDERAPRIREDVALAVHHPDADLVRAAFNAQCQESLCRFIARHSLCF